MSKKQKFQSIIDKGNLHNTVIINLNKILNKLETRMEEIKPYIFLETETSKELNREFVILRDKYTRGLKQMVEAQRCLTNCVSKIQNLVK